ncbi:hypothetical protein AVEN_261823-1 [Araneus ventricosus]|uniref:Uncharacterized protein n=1 Tax=Araneus ventricosus TaxID=182803 RepID=A0A4Y2M031_ARAVE|nr:hypothetical protein AVEN_261823-1 [Araneus ventricosus]
MFGREPVEAWKRSGFYDPVFRNPSGWDDPDAIPLDDESGLGADTANMFKRFEELRWYDISVKAFAFPYLNWNGLKMNAEYESESTKRRMENVEKEKLNLERELERVKMNAEYESESTKQHMLDLMQENSVLFQENERMKEENKKMTQLFTEK